MHIHGAVAALKDSFKKFLTTVFEVIDLQAQESGQETSKIPIILGADSREKYNLEKIVTAAIRAFKEVLEEQGKNIDELLAKVHFYLGLYGKVMRDIRSGETHIQTQEERTAPNQEVLTLLAIENQQNNQLANQWLAQNEEAIKEERGTALKQARQYAYTQGRQRASDLGQVDNWSKFNRFIHTYTKHPLLNDIPRLNYLSWHKDLKKAYRHGYSEASKTKHQVVVKAVNEERERPFVDIVSCYIQDCFQGLGDLSTYAEVMRDQIVPLFRNNLKSEE